MTLATAAPYAVAAWSLDEASSTRFDDVGSSDLTDNGAAAGGIGIFGNAADFESSSSARLYCVDNATVSAGNIDFMLRAWVKFESLSGLDISIVGKGGSNDLEYNLDRAGTGGKFRFRVSSAAGFTNLTAVTSDTFGTPSTGTWYLVHAWHDATNNQIGIAINGGSADLVSYSSGSYDSAGDFNIGAFPFYGNFFDGLIDDVVLLKGYILDATERTADYNGGTGVAFADWGGSGGGATTFPWYYYAQQ